jgi:hypothetical protein
VNFEAAGWWYAVEPEEGEEINYHHDHLALAAILHSVLPDMLSSLWERRSLTATAWEAIKQICIRIQRMCKSNVQQIRREFGPLMWKEAGNTEDFMNRITGLAAELRLIGDNISDAEVVCKMLQVIPDHLTELAISIETLLDIKTISVEEVTGMLRTIEQRRKPAMIHDNQCRLLLYEEEWMANLKVRESEAKGGSSSNSGGSYGKKCGGRGCGRACANSENSYSGSRDSNKVDSGGVPATKHD